jgi:predicted DNA-binding transcriptional regulator AlpA
MASAAGGIPKLLRRKQVMARLNISRWTLSRLIDRDPSFPKFIELSPGVDVIREEALSEWFRSKELESRAAPPATNCTNAPID